MTRFTAIILVIAAAEFGWLANDAAKWFSGVNYINSKIEVSDG